MASENWTEKAGRLHSELARLDSALLDGFVDSPTEQKEIEVAAIARWLRTEFSGDPPEDTATLSLFPLSRP